MHDFYSDDADDFTTFEYNIADVRKNAEADHAPALAAGAMCHSCALYGCGRGPVLPRRARSAHPKLLVVGESPSKQEVAQGLPFADTAGDVVHEALQENGLSADDYSTTLAVLCQPHLPLKIFRERLGKDALKEFTGLDPVTACAPRLQAEIEEAKAFGVKVIAPIGAAALQAVASIHGLRYGSGKAAVGVPTVATIQNQHGAPIDLTSKDGPIIVASLHPAFALKGNRAYLRVIQDDIAKAARIALRGHIDWQRPHYYTVDETGKSPPVEKWIELLNWVRDNARYATIDIETNGIDVNECDIRCVGVYVDTKGKNPFSSDNELVFVVPLRHKKGKAYWTQLDRARLDTALREMLDTVEIIGHNVMTFDMVVLSRWGLISRRDRVAHDTMIAHHDTMETELPHTLSFLMRRLFEAPMHKHDVDHKGTEEADKDYDLHVYCGDDVLVTGRAWKKVARWVIEACNERAYEVDRNIAMTMSQAGFDIGLFIDEHARGRRSLQFNTITKALRSEFERKAEQVHKRYRGHTPLKPYSASSPKQIGDLLWGVVQLTPTLTTAGATWDTGEDASTSLPALLALLDSKQSQIEDPLVTSMIETLVQFRSADKVRSTYLDNIRVTPDLEHAHLDWAPEVIVDGQKILPRRPALSRLSITWKVQTVPTGRLASSPNAQNIPANAFALFITDTEGNKILDENGNPLRAEATNLREIFVAPPGHLLVGSDLEQIEARIYAVDAQDELDLRVLSERDPNGDPFDMHTFTAASVYGPKAQTSTWEGTVELYLKLLKMKKTNKAKYKYLRNTVKVVRYAAVYGAEIDALYRMFTSARDKSTGVRTFPNIKMNDVRLFYEGWHRTHPATKRWQARLKQHVATLGWVDEPVHGRRRWFRDGAARPNVVTNFPIQAHCAGKMNDATLRLVQQIPFRSWSKYTGLCLQVHDYLGFYVPEEKAALTQRLVEEALYSTYGGIPMPGDKALATHNWAQQG